MKAKLVAHARNDGWGIIEMEGEYFVLSPPYKWNCDTCTKEDISVAIAKHDFEPCDKDFDNQAEVVEYLRKEYVAAAEERGIEPITREGIYELLRMQKEGKLWNE